MKKYEDPNFDLTVKIKKLVPEATIPEYAVKGDAGMDLTAVSRTVDKYGNKVYGTGLAMEIPDGYVGFIFPRSSVSKKTLDLANAVGVIDSGYRGEIICKFKPTTQFQKKSGYPYTFLQEELLYDDIYEIGDRIAQLIIMPIPKVQYILCEHLSPSERDKGGFGSTNKTNK